MTPHTSPFFSNVTGYTGEQELLDDLTREQIKIYGIDLLYMPRKLMNLDKLLHESSVSAFETAFPIPMYIKSFDGFDQGMEMLTRFGLRSSDQINFVISRSEFETFYKPFITNFYENQNNGEPLDPLLGQTDTRPKEGDLIYFPFDDSIFEIKYVSFDQPFFQLGKGYTFELQCEKFEYSGETFSTGYENVDDIENDVNYYKLEFQLDAGGTDTYELTERVLLYSYDNLGTEDGDNIADEDGELIGTEQEFMLDDYSGIAVPVASVSAEVMSWDITTRKLVLANFSNVDPTQPDDNYNMDVEKFDNVRIVGQTSGANWTSTSVVQAELYANDNDQIQSEFDAIKIVDAADTDPFGFV